MDVCTRRGVGGGAGLSLSNEIRLGGGVSLCGVPSDAGRRCACGVGERLGVGERRSVDDEELELLKLLACRKRLGEESEVGSSVILSDEVSWVVSEVDGATT